MGDAADGVLTDAELRDKLKEVDSNSTIATPAVQSAARDLLAAATSGTVDEFVEAVTEMGVACGDAGH